MLFLSCFSTAVEWPRWARLPSRGKWNRLYVWGTFSSLFPIWGEQNGSWIWLLECTSSCREALLFHSQYLTTILLVPPTCSFVARGFQQSLCLPPLPLVRHRRTFMKWRWRQIWGDEVMRMKKTRDRLRVKLLCLGNRGAVGRPHTLRRTSRDPVARVIGTTGRCGAAAVRCQEYDVLYLAFRTPSVRPFTHSWGFV